MTQDLIYTTLESTYLTRNNGIVYAQPVYKRELIVLRGNYTEEGLFRRVESVLRRKGIDLSRVRLELSYAKSDVPGEWKRITKTGANF